jgi:sugar (pentulose or hexulose) kinase
VLEGITFYFSRSLKTLADLGAATNELVATGGGSRSDRWLQITADILGVPIVRPHTTEAGTLGAAMNAAVAYGVYADHNQAVQGTVRRDRIFEPIASAHSNYTEWYNLYQDLLQRALPTLRHINQGQAS